MFNVYPMFIMKIFKQWNPTRNIPITLSQSDNTTGGDRCYTVDTQGKARTDPTSQSQV